MPTKKIDARQGPSVIRLLELIEDFITLNEMQNDGTSFGWALCKDRGLVQRLRDGGDLTTTRMDDAIAFMENPNKSHRVITSEGLAINTPLKPLTIKPKEQ